MRASPSGVQAGARDMGAASEIARRLGDQAEAVCRRYLANGRRAGRYWLVGDAYGAKGRSLYVRLVASSDGRGEAGKWTDAATGEHGDLLDIIARVEGTCSLGETLDEARRFLNLPLPANADAIPRVAAPTGSREAARRLFAASQPIAGTVAERYLRARALVEFRTLAALRFHPRCWYMPEESEPPDTRDAWPALIAAVTDLDGHLTGLTRIWLDPDTLAKAPVASPRRAMGDLLGHGVRFGAAGPVMAAGEGIETMLSLRRILPAMPMIAGLSANHLAAIAFPPLLQRLYVARDDDPSGAHALAILADRAADAGIEALSLEPRLDDFNSDLQAFGVVALAEHVAAQLQASDIERFLVDPPRT